jgi:hypothetical protein
MSDVYTPVTSGDPRNGKSVVYADMMGNFQGLSPAVDRSDMPAMTGVLKDRFDNPTYYSA